MLSADYLQTVQIQTWWDKFFFRKKCSFPDNVVSWLPAKQFGSDPDQAQQKNVDLGDLQPQGAMGPEVVCDCAISCTFLFVRQILILEIINWPFAFNH